MPTTITKKYDDLLRETARQWRGWAQSIAEGGSCPGPIDVLQAANILAVDGPPAAALEDDASAIALVTSLEARADELEAAHEALAAAHGGRAGLEEKVEQAARQLQELKAVLARVAGGSGGGHQRQEAARVKSAHPRIWEV